MGMLHNNLISLLQGIRRIFSLLRPDYVKKRKFENELLDVSRHAYPESPTVLSELMLNAQRSGATYIRFDLQNDGRLCIQDDGCGIDDLQTLFSKAALGPSHLSFDSETPFGEGFLGAVYASETMVAASNGMRLQCRTEDVLRTPRLPVTNADTVPGTYMELQLSMDLSELAVALRWRAKGFPIPVILNGNVLPRPHAIDQDLSFVQTDFGQVWIQDLDVAAGLGDARELGVQSCALYLHGLPVPQSPHSHHYGNVVHLDPKQFAARMPDRDCLVGHAANCQFVSDAIAHIWYSQLKMIKACLDSERFAYLYYPTLRKWDALHLLNGVPVLPKSILFEVVGTPILARPLGDAPTFVRPYSGDVISRGIVESGKAIVVLDSVPGPDSLPEWLYAYRIGALCITRNSLPATHWIWKSTIVLEAKVGVEPKGNIVDDKFRGDWLEIDVKECTSIEIQGPLGSVSVDDTCLYLRERGGDEHILIPENAADGEDIRQASTFQDAQYYCNEKAAEREVGMFGSFLLAHRGLRLLGA